MHQISSKTIHLAELQRYVFNSDYNAQPFESDEENELSFVNSAGTWKLSFGDVGAGEVTVGGIQG